jgi:hypothetical protein
MSTQRQWVSATVLPDGRVLGTGGSAVENQLTGVNNVAEIWNPATGTWTQGATGTNARLYHSFGLLAADATVLVGRRRRARSVEEPQRRDLLPAVPVRREPVRAPRVRHHVAPPTPSCRRDLFQVGSAAPALSRVSFIKTGSTTHSFNMDQRYLQLPFTANGALLDVQLPSRAGDCRRVLHAVRAELAGRALGGAHRARRHHHAGSARARLIAAAGGAGGGPFTLACDSQRSLVGVRGSTATYVNQVARSACASNQSGQWIGTPRRAASPAPRDG